MIKSLRFLCVIAYSNINYHNLHYKEGSFIGKKGWAVNSIVIDYFKSSNLLSPIIFNIFLCYFVNIVKDKEAMFIL